MNTPFRSVLAPTVSLESSDRRQIEKTLMEFGEGSAMAIPGSSRRPNRLLSPDNPTFVQEVPCQFMNMPVAIAATLLKRWCARATRQSARLATPPICRNCCLFLLPPRVRPRPRQPFPLAAVRADILVGRGLARSTSEWGSDPRAGRGIQLAVGGQQALVHLAVCQIEAQGGLAKKA